MSQGRNVLQIDNLGYAWPGQAQAPLNIACMRLDAGEAVFLSGESGSGKSTLLNLVTGVLTPDSGDVRFLEQPFSRLSAARRDRRRADDMGYIFQQFNLLPYLSTLDNVLLPARVSRQRRRQAVRMHGSLLQAARYYLQALGIAPELHAREPTRLSIGQQQRVAAARALLGAPALMIADEPTSALDTAHRERFLEQVLRSCREQDTALLFVSHDEALRAHFDRHISMHELQQEVV